MRKTKRESALMFSFSSIHAHVILLMSYTVQLFKFRSLSILEGEVTILIGCIIITFLECNEHHYNKLKCFLF